MYLIFLLSNQMIDNYFKAENVRLRHRSIRNEVSRRGRERIKGILPLVLNQNKCWYLKK